MQTQYRGRNGPKLHRIYMYLRVIVNVFVVVSGASVADLLRRLALKLLAPLRWGSTPMRCSCQFLTECCWFTPSYNVFLQLWKLTAIYNQIWLKNGVKDRFTSPSSHLLVVSVTEVYVYMYMSNLMINDEVTTYLLV